MSRHKYYACNGKQFVQKELSNIKGPSPRGACVTKLLQGITDV